MRKWTGQNDVIFTACNGTKRHFCGLFLRLVFAVALNNYTMLNIYEIFALIRKRKTKSHFSGFVSTKKTGTSPCRCWVYACVKKNIPSNLDTVRKYCSKMQIKNGFKALKTLQSATK